MFNHWLPAWTIQPAAFDALAVGKGWKIENRKPAKHFSRVAENHATSVLLKHSLRTDLGCLRSCDCPCRHIRVNWRLKTADVAADYFSGRRWDCWRRSDACGRRGSSAPPSGRWPPFCRSRRCPPPRRPDSRCPPRPSARPPAAGTASRGRQTQSLWWCWAPRREAASAWCPLACRE